MVTYLAKEARGGAAAFTQEAMQLEAYCSGVGKVLLAYLPGPERDAYLSEGPFVALTANTLVQPEELRRDLETIRSQGWACDNEEVFDGLVCLAVPVRRGEGLVHAALSVSASRSTFDAAYRTATLAALSDAAAEVEARLPL